MVIDWIRKTLDMGGKKLGICKASSDLDLWLYKSCSLFCLSLNNPQWASLFPGFMASGRGQWSGAPNQCHKMKSYRYRFHTGTFKGNLEMFVPSIRGRLFKVLQGPNLRRDSSFSLRALEQAAHCSSCYAVRQFLQTLIRFNMRRIDSRFPWIVRLPLSC